MAGASTYTHSIAGGWNSSGGSFTFTAGSSTVVLSGAVPSITTKGIGVDPFNNLTLNNGGSMASAVEATGNLLISGGTLGLGVHNLSVGGNLTGNALTASGAEAISVGGNWNVALFTPATSTVSFTGASGAGPFTVSSNSQSFSGVTLNAGGKTYQQAAGATGVANIGGALTLTAGTWSSNGDALSVGGNLTGAGSLTATGTETISVGGSFTPTAFTAASSTVVMNGAATPVSLGGLSFNNLTLNKGAGAAQVSSTGGLTVSGALSMTQGTWVAGASTYTHSIAGGWNSSGASFTFTAGSSTVVLSGAVPSITTKGIGVDPFNNLTLNNGGSMASAVEASGNLLISGGTLGLGVHNLTVGGNLTGAGSLTATGTETITVGGSFTPTAFTAASSHGGDERGGHAGESRGIELQQSDAEQGSGCSAGELHGRADGERGVEHDAGHVGGGSLDVHAQYSGRVELLGGELHVHGGQLDGGAEPERCPSITTKGIGVDPFNNLTLNNGGSMASAVEASGNLLISGGTLGLGVHNLTVGGNLTGAGSLTATGTETITVGGSFTPTAFTAASSTVVMNGAATPVSLGGLSFNNLTLNKGAGAAQVSSTGGLTVSGALSMTQGTWVAGASTYTHSIAGGWNSSGGSFTFTAGSSTVVLSASGARASRPRG